MLKGEIDISFTVTHRLPIEDGPAAYRTFRDKKDNCIKVVLKPWGPRAGAVGAGPRGSVK